ncbi:unnamed protein product [Clonostachys rhizophaga]|uniref:NIPA-like protein 2 n=1 Tax=Clonostachys rhizophaga TaxID=160324 RepID=A0A9N9V268_9HYPO|nr:unnamed protein product [Clonostachys rhizophaga]
MSTAHPGLPWSSFPIASGHRNGTFSGGKDGGGKDGNGGETLQEWSSLIGIVTAIVGNMLIALALNVQRYAHTRLHKQRISVRRRAKAAMRRAQNGSHSRSYGTVDGDGNGVANGTYKDDDHGGQSGYHDNDSAVGDSHETDPLNASTHSTISTEETPGEDDEQPKETSTYLKSPYWWLGQVLITLGEMGNFLAYGFAPASIVSPLGVVALVSNCLIAPLMFHEKFRQRDFLGVVVAVGGVVTVVLSANTEETKLKPDDVWDAITSLPFEIYLSVTVALIILLMWASPKYGRQTILIDLGLVGLFGGYTALATKGVSSMLSSTLWRAFTTPVTYALILILLGTAIMQIRYVNKSLQRFDSTQVIPIQFVMFTLCVIVGSAVLYRDFEKTTREQAGKFIGGCLLTFFGVFLITSGREPAHDDEDCLSEVDGVEETIGLENQDGNHESVPRTPDTPGSTTATRTRRPSEQSRANYFDNPNVELPHEERPMLLDLDHSDADIPHITSGSLEGDTGSTLFNPWTGAPSTPPRRGIRTLSADSVLRGPTGISSPNRSHPTTPNRDDRLIMGLHAEPGLTPQNRASTYAPGHKKNRSGTFISPSPLASTVTTVMKDGLLYRDDDAAAPTYKSSMRQLRSRIRASLFFNEDEGGPVLEGIGHASEGDLVAGVPGFQPYRDNEDGEHDDRDHDNLIQHNQQHSRTRSRSVSDAIGDFFRPKRKKRKSDANADVERGDYFDTPAGPTN